MNWQMTRRRPRRSRQFPTFLKVNSFSIRSISIFPKKLIKKRVFLWTHDSLCVRALFYEPKCRGLITVRRQPFWWNFIWFYIHVLFSRGQRRRRLSRYMTKSGAYKRDVPLDCSVKFFHRQDALGCFSCDWLCLQPSSSHHLYLSRMREIAKSERDVSSLLYIKDPRILPDRASRIILVSESHHLTAQELL